MVDVADRLGFAGPTLTLGSVWLDQQNTSKKQVSAPSPTKPVTTANPLSPANRSDDVKASRKRSRDGSAEEEASYSKAQREKMRRDRLNDRFLELGRELDPSTTARTDKGIILGNAVRALSGLKAEAASLKQSTWQLQEQIKELKAEKSELRDEKARLKAQREFLQLQIQALPIPRPDVYASAVPSAATAAAIAALQAAAGPHLTSHMATKPFLAAAPAQISEIATNPPQMWQWLPPVSVETSNDRSLRPLVA